ncbi:MAG TPA: methyltransferase domain-containing protein [Gaiellaceae bacterium]|nr:methyltransferase domain-containing protein [Gaiellaceae bacterium]
MGLRSRWMRRLWSDAEAAYRAKILAALEPQPGARLLDVGCDDGAWTDVVRRRLAVPPVQVAGVEIVPAQVERALARGFDVRAADLDERWPFEDNSFDVVHANQVIEHVRRLDHFVAEMKRILRPQGRALVCTENLASWHNVAALVFGYQPFSLTNISGCRPIGNPLALHAGEASPVESWHHVHVLSLTALRDLFVAHGFVIDATWGAGYHPLGGRLASRLAALDPRHAHFIGLVARGRSILESEPGVPPAPRAAARERPRYKLLTVAAALYVMLPFDVIPDFIPVVGHFDDAIVVALVLQSVRHQWLDRLRRFVRRRVASSAATLP